jgi:hypothetical protein
MTEDELMDEFQEIWIGEPKHPKVDDEYLKYIERFITENELYD